MTAPGWAAARERTEKATAAPWRHYRNKLRPNFGGTINEVQCAERTPVVTWRGFDDSTRPEKKHAANADFITHVRFDAPRAYADLDLALALAWQVIEGNGEAVAVQMAREFVERSGER